MERRIASRFSSAAALAVTSAALFALPGCLPQDETVPLTGVSAFKKMRVDRSQAPRTDIASVQSLIDQQTAGAGKPGDDAVEPAAPVASLMQKTTKARIRLGPKTRFQWKDATVFAKHRAAAKRSKPDGVNVGALQHDKYTVPRVDQIPVRNQGQRGSCASFAGVGQLEYKALATYGGLQTLDLSEQRFYYMSRPDCLEGHSPYGCTVDEEGGSWYGDGYTASSGDAEPPGENIPLELDCPYNPNPGDNELQAPQLSSCGKGAAKVGNVHTISTPQEVVAELERGLPVPWASPLSDNWFENKGLITSAAAGDAGDVMHAGGHAYLLVGYQKLPSMPEEGGMCFIVKNSWGTGWGVNGYSCQTLKWMQEWRFLDDNGNKTWLDEVVVDDVALSPEAAAGAVPDNSDAEDNTPPDVPDEELDDGDSSSDDLGPLPEPDPGPGGWGDVPLYGPNDSYYVAQRTEDANGPLVRVALNGATAYSNPLYNPADGKRLAYEAGGGGTYLEYDGERVGELRATEGDLLLCTGKYSMICSLRLNSDNALYIEFPYPGNRKVQPSEVDSGQGGWVSLLTSLFLGYDVQYFAPNDATSLLTSDNAFVRLQPPGAAPATDPLRVGHDSEGEIKVMNNPVGHLLKFELCNGDYSDACRFLSADNRFWVLPSW